MLIDVRTDGPDSVIMPEVLVPANATSVTVPVQGGKPGNGLLFFTSSARLKRVCLRAGRGNV